jgi:hypothetical protein
MRGLFFALLAGLILAVGATAITSVAVNGVAKGTPSNQSLYNYGTR